MGGKASTEEASTEEVPVEPVEPRTLPLSRKEKLFTDAVTEAMASVKDAEQAAKAARNARAIALQMQKRLLEICPDPPPPDGLSTEEHHHHHHHRPKPKPKPTDMEEFLGVPVDGEPIPVEICKDLKAVWGQDGKVDEETAWAVENTEQVEREMKLSANAAMQALLDPLVATPEVPSGTEAEAAASTEVSPAADAAQTGGAPTSDEAGAAEGAGPEAAAAAAAAAEGGGAAAAGGTGAAELPRPDLDTRHCHLHCATTHVPGERIHFPEWMPPAAPPELPSPAVLQGQHFL